MSGGYRARHHKYFTVPDARDQILQRHQAAGVEDARRVPSAAIQEAAARGITIPVPAGIRVQDSVLVELPVIRHCAAHAAYDDSCHDCYAAEYGKVRAASLPIESAIPAERPYVPVRPRGVRVAGVAPAPPAQIAQELLSAAFPTLTPARAAEMASQLVDVPLPLVEPAPAPEAPYTLETLPIGHHDFEFLCGTAGTGKTWLAKKLLELSPPGSVVLAATTGIASVNLGEGTTINALLGFFNTADLIEKFTNGRLQSMLRKHRAAGLRRILLDEVSMMDARQLTVITRAIVEVNQPRDRKLESIGIGGGGDEDEESDTSAGEIPPQIGITLVGDFAQLSPVPDTNDATNEKIPAQYAFESPEWPRYAAHVHRLTKIYRQDNQAFIQALHAVRRGDAAGALAFFTPEKFADHTDQTFPGTTIFAKNIEVDRYNQLRLDQLTTPAITAETRRWGKQRGDWKQIPDQLVLKEGALVMILANRRDIDTQRMIYANGDLGVLLGRHSDGAWQVHLHRTQQSVFVQLQLRENTIPLGPGRRKELREQEQTHRITKDGKSEIIGTVVYMPLRCAYGASVHKTQGLTLDTVQINLRDGFFKHPGMAFVALSRARTPEGLRLVGDPRTLAERCRVDPRTVPWL